MQQIEFQTKQQEIDILKEKLEANQQKKAKTQKELDKKLKENKRLQDEIRRLQARKAEEQRIAQAQAKNPVLASPVPSGGCLDWLKQAGVSDIQNAYNIIQKESGCSPTASNPISAAHGVCQSLPASKMASYGADYLTNPITQMRWCQDYAISRYGSWANAWAFWQANRWW